MTYTKTTWVNGQAPAISAANLNKIENELESLDTFTSGLLNTLFPVGKVEIFYDNNDHSNYLGFTWQKIATGKTLVGIDTSDTDFDTIGNTGGEKTHKLTKQEMPSHNHEIAINGGSDTGAQFTYNYTSGKRFYGGTDIISNTGSGQAHNNLPPYEVVAIWKRTA